MASAAANNLCICGRYTLLGKLGAGGHGEVWRARDHEQGYEVALKILSPELARKPGAWEALQREYEVASRLDHPLILKVYRPERDGGLAVLPMELAPGGDLRRLRSVSYLEIGPVLLEVAQALAHAHERGVVHRDLKPGNVLFDARGHVRLADFGAAGTLLGSTGLAGLAGAASAAGASAAEPGRVSLSPFTASPEQLRGDPPAVTDDVYGLGALAYELLSGYPPYYPRFELRRATEEPVPLLKPAHQAPDRLIALVMLMLSKRAQHRPTSMKQVMDTLGASLNDTLTFDEEVAPAEAEPDAPVAAIDALGTVRATPSRGGAPLSEPVAPMRAAWPERLAQPEQPERSEQSAQPEQPARSEPSPPSEPSDQLERLERRLEPAREPDLRGLWADIKVERMATPARRPPEHHVRWPWVLIAALAAAAVVSFFWLPRWAGVARSWVPSALASLERAVPPPVMATIKRTAGVSPHAVPAPLQGGHSVVGQTNASSSPTSPVAGESLSTPSPDAGFGSSVQSAREHFEARLGALDARGAGIWGGQAYADAKAREAEALGADEAGNQSLAVQKLSEAERLLGDVERSAPIALAAQLSSGERALKAGNSAAAHQAFELAHRIDPSSAKAMMGLQRAQVLDRVLPLLVDGLNAEAGRNYLRAAQDYRRMLSLDPTNAKARAGLQRANAAMGSDDYARAVGAGLDALGAERLTAARQAFELAHRIDPHGHEAEEGLERVSAAQRNREIAALQARGTALEAQQRWREALQTYDAALQIDPSLSFAQQGRARAAAEATSGEPGAPQSAVGGTQTAAGGAGVEFTGAGDSGADLARRLQALTDDPAQLDSAAIREEAAALIREASEVRPARATLRELEARLSVLLSEYDKTVHLALISDNVTEVEIPRIGSFGTFVRREIDLKPGKYTVIGTRAGYRDVRRDVTIEPGQEPKTISVRCEEPI